MTPQEKQQLEELIEFKRQLENSFSVPKDVVDALGVRLNQGKIVKNTKSASSENKAVNEGGVATYSVLLPPDRFHKVTLENGTVSYIPAYD